MSDTSAELIDVYRRAINNGEKPVPAIARHFKISDGAAKARLHRLRAKHLLPGHDKRNVVLNSTNVVVVNERVRPHLEVAERTVLEQVFRKHFEQAGGPLRVCSWCHGIHERACPAVRRVRFSDSGERVIEIEFRDHYSDDDIIWPSDLELDDIDEEGTA